MREILYRGKKINNKEWVDGSIVKLKRFSVNGDAYYIYPYDNGSPLSDVCKYYEVIPETVGQYIGIKDKTNYKMFEDDIIRHSGEIGIISYSTTCGNFCVLKPNTDILQEWGVWFRKNEEYEIIGNIFDTPELLENTN